MDQPGPPGPLSDVDAAPSAAEARAVAEALRNAAQRRTGIALLAAGREALALRVALARGARRRLDLQYYLWHGDRSGQLLAREVLRAADRQVQVRLLLDDAFAIGRDRVLAALDEHPMISVRLFNSTRWRRYGQIGFLLELMLGSWHLNRRMHNKAWIADGGRAIAGGRNIGDAYFDAAEDFNFRDLDLILAGPAAAETEVAFERYWSSPMAKPARRVSAARSGGGGLAALRRSLDAWYRSADAARLLADLPDPAALEAALPERLIAVRPEAVRVVADPPEKALRGLRARRRAAAAGGLNPEVVEALRGARQEVILISPYFVPGKAGLALLQTLTARGVAVSVVTNSLAATDVVAVHGGYARYRRALLEAGIALFELKRSGDEAASVFGSRGASLHTKAFVVDEARICVGSFNLDPRSVLLNTEMAVFAENADLARSLRAEHARLTSPERSWRVSLEDGALRWMDVDGTGRGRILGTEPDASPGRRAVALLTRLLPVENQL